MSQKGVNIKIVVLEASIVQKLSDNGKAILEYHIKYSNPILGPQSLRVAFPTFVVKAKLEELIKQVAPANPGGTKECVIQLYVKEVNGRQYPNTLNDILPADAQTGEVEFELTNAQSKSKPFTPSAGGGYTKAQESIEIQCCFKQAVNLLIHNKADKEISVEDVKKTTHDLYTLVLQPLIKSAKEAEAKSSNEPSKGA